MTENQGKQIISLREKGLGYKKIANIVGISRDSVRSYCKSRGLVGYVQPGEDIVGQIKMGRACKFCGAKIEKNKTGRPAKFCSNECRRRYWKDHRSEIKKSDSAIYIRECSYCHETFESYGNKNRKFCCHDHYIKYRFYTD